MSERQHQRLQKRYATQYYAQTEKNVEPGTNQQVQKTTPQKKEKAKSQIFDKHQWKYDFDEQNYQYPSFNPNNGQNDNLKRSSISSQLSQKKRFTLQYTDRNSKYSSRFSQISYNNNRNEDNTFKIENFFNWDGNESYDNKQQFNSFFSENRQSLSKKSTASIEYNYEEENLTAQNKLIIEKDAQIKSFKESMIKQEKESDEKLVNFKYPNNDKYFGFVDNLQQFNGLGLYETDYGDIFIGTFSNSKFHGYGTYFFRNGERFEGLLVNGVKSGRGKYFYKNGNLYEGLYNNNKKHGSGMLTDHAEGKKYRVEYRNGELLKKEIY